MDLPEFEEEKKSTTTTLQDINYALFAMFVEKKNIYELIQTY